MSDNSNSKLLIDNIKWIYFAKIISQIIGIISSIYVIKSLNISMYGSYNLAIGFFIIPQIFILSSITSVINRYIPEFIEQNNFQNVVKLIKNSLLISLIGIILFFVGFDFCSNYFNLISKIPNIEKIKVYFYAFCLFYLYQLIWDSILKSCLLQKKVSLIIIINNLLRFILYIIFYKKITLEILLSIEAVLALVYSFQASYIFIKFIKIKKSIIKEETNNSNKKRVLKYGLLSLVNELGVGIIGKSSDIFIVAAFSSSVQIGLFSFSHKIYEFFYKILPFKDIQSIIRPLFIKKFGQEYDIEEFKKYYLLLVKILIPIYSFPFIFYFIFGKSIVYHFFSIEYLNSYYITCVILFTTIPLAFFYPLSLFVQLKEKMEVLLYSKIIFVFSILLSIILIKYFGIIGVAIASLIGDLIKNLIIVFFMRDYKEIRLKWLDFKNFFYVNLLILPLFFFNSLHENLMLFILYSIVFIIYLFFLYIIFLPFNQKEIIILKEITSKSKILSRIFNLVLKLSKIKNETKNNFI
jgi:O-antigen/teichoic acid export membrane protein